MGPAGGKGERVAKAADEESRPTGTDELRSVAQLNMLHSLAAKLNALGDVAEIGAAIAAELRTIIDYHNCRVYVLQPDRSTLLPIAFRGELFTDYERETLDDLITTVGKGITGHVAETRTSLLTPDARLIDFSVTIPGTDDDLLESMLAVPMLSGDAVVGVIVLSKLGFAQFDVEDQRMLEVLASHAAVALQNAGLLQAEREAAQAASALLGLSQALTGRRNVGDILQQALESIPSIVPCSAVGAYVRDEETGDFRLARLLAVDEAVVRPRAEIADVPAEVAAAFPPAGTEPFVVTAERVSEVHEGLHIVKEPREVLVAPLTWDPDALGTLTLVAERSDARFTERDLRLARGIADITSLALGNARRLTELERFHELMESLDAIFWEADATTLELTFLGGRPGSVLGPDAPSWPDKGSRWGDHIVEDDRAAALDECRRAIEAARDQHLEYRVRSPKGDVVWVRDLVHVVGGAQGPRQLRGLMVDITERKLAEQALLSSERKYLEAFRREREAAQRLRALDDMKNTFLEAVSHDLRTPLTSILGSALTLEQSRLQLPHDDALDLIRRIASNAKKLERLLGDLLDLDRLQRGIVSPQRRPTDLRALVQRAVDETENPQGRPVDVDVEPVTASVDAAKVERIVENLVSNALRHTPANARVWVRAEGRDGGVLLTVDDDGPGIPRELREEVFEPFRQAPGSAAGHSPGVGIGLSLVRRFAELHGGRAWVEERPGGGSRFSVFLPGG
jgi:signal transduction histidine kinase/GAF domain-containing protein